MRDVELIIHFQFHLRIESKNKCAQQRLGYPRQAGSLYIFLRRLHKAGLVREATSQLCDPIEERCAIALIATQYSARLALQSNQSGMLG